MITEILKNISIIFAAFSVIYGIGAWRREYIGKRQIDLAEEILALFYEAKDLISMIRNPVRAGGEGKTREADETENSEEKEIRDRAFVVFERYLENQEIFNKLHAKRYIFMARFGSEIGEPFIELRKVISEIFSAAKMLPRFWLRQGHGDMNTDESKRHLEQMHKLEAVFWEHFDDQDPINLKVDKIIQDIECMCRPIIDRRRFTDKCNKWVRKK